ncbi:MULTISPECIES: DUF3761 domain-containing protein [unclassified Gordonia (in: high G+C Gram-positive bacteria)]|uniref:DUF3761 domain-containing protein n=2 Tax=Gordoniaceae TaxID=85026 RepID=UPI000990D879|nr:MULTISPECIES: DUF3761 domain-containing protein [unclassified Gordonia (in: high G+C Gram-positive bacteria)]
MPTMTARRLLAGLATVLALTIGSLLTGAAIGDAPAGADPAIHEVDYSCGSGWYENSDGNCVPGPDNSPTGIRCKDGTYSHAKNRQGACSRHGGIADGSGTTGAGSDESGSSELGVGSAVIGSSVIGAALLGALLFGSS